MREFPVEEVISVAVYMTQVPGTSARAFLPNAYYVLMTRQDLNYALLSCVMHFQNGCRDPVSTDV
jgi:hypothetical protein